MVRHSHAIDVDGELVGNAAEVGGCRSRPVSQDIAYAPGEKHSLHQHIHGIRVTKNLEDTNGILQVDRHRFKGFHRKNDG